MKVNKVVHLIVQCSKCHKQVTQYLNEEPVFEIIKENDKPLDYCMPCADKYYEDQKDGM